ncbi:MAG: FtsH protease activity modulator HflK [Dongiaceae bacterium]
MTWNNNGGPWGQPDDDAPRPRQKSQQSGPSSREQWGGGDWFKNRFPGGANNPSVYGFAVLALVGLWLLSGVYRVEPAEMGVVLRFGEYNRTTPPGLHMHLPWPVETVLTPNVSSINRIDIGFRTGEAQGRTIPADVAAESQMLTADQNILHMQFRVQWQVKDPVAFLFNIRSADAMIRTTAESVMRELVGQQNFDVAVLSGRAELASQARERLQQLLDSYKAGIMIVDIQPQKVDPPAEVIDAFNDVQRAEQDAQRERNMADGYRRDIVPRARGEAQKILQDAEAYKQRMIKEAQGEAERFNSVYAAYRQANTVTSQRLYIETMQEVLRNSNRVIVDTPKGGTLSVLPLQDVIGNKAKRDAAPSTPIPDKVN